ncbi:sterol desaturase [Swaminathania salitolerans LMG 21291]|uniref:Fatty acid hydroxylase domain-containing protein n=1 Tax=Swaminathania salitolerans TaxID=182838 RepID=A0A511BPL7_9PROT|nr:sterol desaturase [Swaminathania salitolerans LMG 21291]GEL01594.1 hypothetical protein SSA02_07570 [Swaminathania salitolerans]
MKQQVVAGRDYANVSVRLFNSAALERLTYMPMHWFLPVWGVILASAGWSCRALPLSRCFALACLGLAIWTLTEYFAHRFLFHLNLRSRQGKQFIFLIHGNHHDDPSDYLRNMMPLVVTLPLAFLIWALMGTLYPNGGAALFLGFALGYVLYDFVHYATHQYSSRFTLFKKLKQHHLRHHHIAEHCNYAVTAIFWDRVFGTRATGRKR